MYAHLDPSFRTGLASMLTGIAIIILGATVTLAGLGPLGLAVGLEGLGMTFLGSRDMTRRPDAPPRTG